MSAVFTAWSSLVRPASVLDIMRPASSRIRMRCWRSVSYSTVIGLPRRGVGVHEVGRGSTRRPTAAGRRGARPSRERARAWGGGRGSREAPLPRWRRRRARGTRRRCRRARAGERLRARARGAAGAAAAGGSAWDVEARENAPADRIGVKALDLRLGAQDQPVAQRRDGERLHVVRSNEVAALDRGGGLRGAQQVHTGAGARAEQQVGRLPRLLDDANHVLEHRVLHGDAVDLSGALVEHTLRERLELVDLRERLSLVVRAEDRLLLRRLGIAHDRLEQEAIELGLGKRVGPLVLDRVLRRDDEERPRQGPRVAFERDLLLLHRLEERGLRLRRCAVHLVGEDDVREDRTFLDAEVARRDLVDGGADDVARHQVGRELDPLERAADEPRDRAREEGLRGTGHALDEQMPAEKERDEREAGGLVLPDHDAMHVAVEALRDFARAPAHRVPTSRCIWATVRSSWSSRKRRPSASSTARASAARSRSVAPSVARTRSNGIAGSRPSPRASPPRRSRRSRRRAISPWPDRRTRPAKPRMNSRLERAGRTSSGTGGPSRRPDRTR